MFPSFTTILRRIYHQTENYFAHALAHGDARDEQSPLSSLID